MKALAIVAMFVMLLVGCKTAEPTVETTKCWEGHYYNTNDFVTATKQIELGPKESIWVLSNRTLSRLLQNTGK